MVSRRKRRLIKCRRTTKAYAPVSKVCVWREVHRSRSPGFERKLNATASNVLLRWITDKHNNRGVCHIPERNRRRVRKGREKRDKKNCAQKFHGARQYFEASSFSPGNEPSEERATALKKEDSKNQTVKHATHTTHTSNKTPFGEIPVTMVGMKKKGECPAARFTPRWVKPA